MDRKSLIVLAVSFVLLALWFWLIPKMYPPIPAPSRTNDLAGITNTIALTNGAAVSTNLAPTPPTPAPVTVLPPEPLVPATVEEQTLTLENAEASFTFTSHGGGLKAVRLKGYPETVGCDEAERGRSALATLNHDSRVPVLGLRGGEALTGDHIYQLRAVSPSEVRAEKLLSNGLFVVKTFSLTSNYLVHGAVRFENRSSTPLALPIQSLAVGAATPVGPQEDARMLRLSWYDGEDSHDVDLGWFENSTMGCIPGTPRSEYVAGLSNVAWVAVQNQFFTIAVIAATNQPAGQVAALRLNWPGAVSTNGTRGKPAAPRQGLEASLIYPGLTLPANEALERAFTIYAGPKEYKRLSRFRNNLDLVMEYDGFFGWFAKVLLLSMNGLHTVVPNYGLTIIIITIIIKLVFWPLTQASTRSMKRMQALQPQMKALQEKYKDDPAKMNRKLMEFMKEHKVSPLGGCLPMLLQIPVFFGFFKMIQSAIELRGARFLWACDLSKPDTVAYLPGLDFPINPLPLLMGVTMLWQAKLTPASPGMDPVQQKIMKYMPLMFMVFLYNFSAGLTLYWTVQNLLTIAQMKLTRAKDEPVAPSAPAKPVPGWPPKKKKK